MHPSLIRYNNQLLITLFVAIILIQSLIFFVAYVLGTDLPMGNLAFGVAVYGVLMLFYNRNKLWPQILTTPWVLIFCIYIAISYVYGLWRFKTPSTATFDLWLFAFIPAVVLIRPFSFSGELFDKLISVLILLYVLSALVLLTIIPETLYNRAFFAHYIAIPGTFGAGSAYLLLKHANKIGTFTLIGLFGTLVDAVVYGVAGAFRGRLIMALLAILLFLILLLRSQRVGFEWKFLTILTSTILCSIALLVSLTKFDEQLSTLTDRFANLAEIYQETGDVFMADSRLAEMQYFMFLNPNKKLILGHGIGGLWLDVHGMFAVRDNVVHGRAASETRFEGARTMLHTNWIHILFKIGAVGFLILLLILVNHYRRNRFLIKGNYGWWAFLFFYCAWTTYYGDKALNARSIVYLIVLVQPWLFRTTPKKPRMTHASDMSSYPYRYKAASYKLLKI